MNKGFIKLHRSLLEWEWWDDHNAVRLLTYLLCAVNWQDKKWREITIKAGSMVLSWENLADRTGLSVQQCRTAMSKLERSGEVNRQVTNKYQLVSLVKWDKLQLLDDDTTSNPTGKQQASNKQVTTTKESKEDKEVYSARKYDFKQALIDNGAEPSLAADWMVVRKTGKASNTETALNGFLNQVEKSGLTINQVLKICCERSWKGFNANWDYEKPKQKYGIDKATGYPIINGVIQYPKH